MVIYLFGREKTLMKFLSYQFSVRPLSNEGKFVSSIYIFPVKQFQLLDDIYEKLYTDLKGSV